MLEVVRDYERYLCFSLSRRTVITTHSDQAISGFNHKGEPVHIVDTYEVLDFLGRQLRMK